MALPVAWTESSLIAAMEDELQAVAEPLGLLDLDVIATSVMRNVPAVLKVTSVEAVTYGSVDDVVKVWVIACWKVWQRAYEVTLPKTRLRAGTAEIFQSEAWEHLKEQLARAEAAAMAYPEAQAAIAGGGVAVVGATTTAGSPYGWAAYPEFGA
jgi:hypothetical protein